MYQGEVTIVTQPELKRGEDTGVEFAVCRAVIERQEYRKAIGANVTVATYIGLTAFEEMGDLLLAYGVRDRVAVSGKLTEQQYVKKDGTPATDIKLLLSAIAPALVRAVDADGQVSVAGQHAVMR